VVVVADLEQAARLDGGADGVVVFQGRRSSGLGKHLRSDTASSKNDTTIREFLIICFSNVEFPVTNAPSAAWRCCASDSQSVMHLRVHSLLLASRA
jgi:hypothetical protein